MIKFKKIWFVFIFFIGSKNYLYALRLGNNVPNYPECQGFNDNDRQRINGYLNDLRIYFTDRARDQNARLVITRAMCKAKLAPDRIFKALLVARIYAIDSHLPPAEIDQIHIGKRKRAKFVNDFLTRTSLEKSHYHGGRTAADVAARVFRLRYQDLKFMHGGVNPNAEACYAPNGSFVANAGANCPQGNHIRTYIENLPFVLQSIINGVYTLQDVVNNMPAARLISIREDGGGPIVWYTLDHRRVMMVALLAQVLHRRQQNAQAQAQGGQQAAYLNPKIQYLRTRVKVRPRSISPTSRYLPVVGQANSYLSEIEARLSAKPLNVAVVQGQVNRYVGAHPSGECVELEDFPNPLPNVPAGQVSFCRNTPSLQAPVLRNLCEEIFRDVIRSGNSMCLN